MIYANYNGLLYPRRYITWDLETSGLDHKENKILEIGAMKFEDGVMIEQKSWLLNHHIEIPPLITKITTITKSILDDQGMDPSQALNEFLGWFDDFGWANLTHNGFRFDIQFLISAIFKDGVHRIGEVEEIRENLYRNGIDTAALYKGREINVTRHWNENFAQYAARVLDIRAPGVKYNVAHCCKQLGIDTTNTTMHRALGDVHLTNQIYEKLTL